MLGPRRHQPRRGEHGRAVFIQQAADVVHVEMSQYDRIDRLRRDALGQQRAEEPACLLGVERAHAGIDQHAAAGGFQQ